MFLRKSALPITRRHLPLHEVTLEVPAGKTVALVGPSGSGKSTMMNLLMRFYDVTDGQITIDGQDLRRLDFASLRSAIGLVSQEVMLFDATVAENIAYGKEGSTREEIAAAGTGSSST